MRRNQVIGAAASIALAVGALTLVPASAQASSVCGATARVSTWYIQAYIGTINPCYEVQVRASVYNNYGLAGNYESAASTNWATLNIPQSNAPGTYTTHAYRSLIKGKSWSAWLNI